MILESSKNVQDRITIGRADAARRKVLRVEGELGNGA
jgi:hypothetical protein